MSADPYLVPGAVCEVWDKHHFGERHIKKFYEYNFNGQPTFRNIGEAFGVTYFNYRVLDTEWTHAPDWAVCSTVDYDGRIRFWNTKDIRLTFFDDQWTTGDMYTHAIDNSMVCGICPDKTRYQGEAWKTSLRMRPEWAIKK